MVDVESGGAVLEANKLWLLEFVWKTKAHSKVLLFGWRMVLRSLSLRAELAKRHIIVGALNTVCHFCLLLEERLNHFFLLFYFSIHFWTEACGWIGARGSVVFWIFSNFFAGFY